MKGKIKVNIVDPPAFGLKRKEILEDIALLTNSQIINEDLGDDLNTIEVDYLGTCLKTTTNNDQTIIQVESISEEVENIISNIKDKSFFYFVHSYFVDPINESEILSTTNYGCTFTSGVSRDNFVALQFHPEKSSSDGLKVLKNFITWDIS